MVEHGSILAKLKELAVERRIFAYGGYAAMGGMALTALMALFLGQNMVSTIIHLVSLGSSIAMVSDFARDVIADCST